jgi:hypothetical protein
MEEGGYITMDCSTKKGEKMKRVRIKIRKNSNKNNLKGGKIS